MNEAVIVRSRWTPDDEARLKELAERKARIYSDNIGLLSEALSGCTESGGGNRAVAEFLSQNADAVLFALEPFASKEPK